MAKVIWVKALEQDGDADCLADVLSQAVNEPAHRNAILSVRSNCSRFDYISGIAVVCDEDDPEETSDWEVYLLEGDLPAVGDIVI